jgi:hypothetical protein
MPQREPARRQTAGEPPSSKVKMRLDENGRWVPLLPEAADTRPASEAAERPPTLDHPRNPHARPE